MLTRSQVALLGVKNAIVIGDLRALYLLLWAGLSQRIHVEYYSLSLPTSHKVQDNHETNLLPSLLIWTLQNGSDNILAILELLITLGQSEPTSSDVNKFHNALYVEQDKRGFDSDYIEFIEALQNSATIQAWDQRASTGTLYFARK
jgi:hypothetical protein